MEEKKSIRNYIQNFDHEFDDKKKWLNIHIFEIQIEITQIENTMKIFKIVNDEWENRVLEKKAIDFSLIRNTLFNALPYRVILGLSKILAITKSEYSLNKTINIISQMEEYKENPEILQLQKEARIFLESSELVNVVKVYRDQYFGHLDKESVISDLRLDPTIAMKDINFSDLAIIKDLLARLYEACFQEELTFVETQFSKEDVLKKFDF